jgi:hypothetical protein
MHQASDWGSTNARVATMLMLIPRNQNLDAEGHDAPVGCVWVPAAGEWVEWTNVDFSGGTYMVQSYHSGGRPGRRW